MLNGKRHTCCKSTHTHCVSAWNACGGSTSASGGSSKTIQIDVSKSINQPQRCNFIKESEFPYKTFLIRAYPVCFLVRLKLAKEATTLNFYFIFPINLARVRGGFWVVIFVVPIENDANWKNSNRIKNTCHKKKPFFKSSGPCATRIYKAFCTSSTGSVGNASRVLLLGSNKHIQFFYREAYQFYLPTCLSYTSQIILASNFLALAFTKNNRFWFHKKNIYEMHRTTKNSILCHQPMCLDQQKNFTGARSWAAKHGPNSTKLTYIRFHCMCIFIVVIQSFFWIGLVKTFFACTPEPVCLAFLPPKWLELLNLVYLSKLSDTILQGAGNIIHSLQFVWSIDRKCSSQ